MGGSEHRHVSNSKSDELVLIVWLDCFRSFHVSGIWLWLEPETCGSSTEPLAYDYNGVKPQYHYSKVSDHQAPLP